MIYYEKLMKRFISPLITIGLSLLLALCSAALTYSAPSTAGTDFTTGAAFMQTTPTAQQTDGKSEMGSTDQIIIMGGVITGIIVVPILLKRGSWR